MNSTKKPKTLDEAEEQVNAAIEEWNQAAGKLKFAATQAAEVFGAAAFKRLSGPGSARAELPKEEKELTPKEERKTWFAEERRSRGQG